MVINPKVAHLKNRIISQVQELPCLGASASSCRTYADYINDHRGPIDACGALLPIASRLAASARHAPPASNSTSEVDNRTRTPRAMKLRCSAGLELTPRQPGCQRLSRRRWPGQSRRSLRDNRVHFRNESRAASAAPQAALSGSNPKAPALPGILTFRGSTRCSCETLSRLGIPNNREAWSQNAGRGVPSRRNAKYRICSMVDHSTRTCERPIFDALSCTDIEGPGYVHGRPDAYG